MPLIYESVPRHIIGDSAEVRALLLRRRTVLPLVCETWRAVTHQPSQLWRSLLVDLEEQPTVSDKRAAILQVPSPVIENLGLILPEQHLPFAALVLKALASSAASSCR